MERFQKYKLLIENIFSLFVIRGFEYIVSFLTFPYLVRTVGISLFGSIAFTQSIIAYFSLFTDYGFNMTGPRDIAKHDSREERGAVFASIFGAKVLLLLVSFIPFIGLLWYVGKFTSYHPALFAVVYISVVGNVISPVWFFQGIQQMRYITLVNTIARIVTAMGIFVIVQTEDDYLWAAFLQAVPPFIAGCVSWILLKIKFPEVCRLPAWNGIKTALRDGWDIFASNIAINLYTGSNTAFLGMMTNSTIVGYFSCAQKIVSAIRQGLTPFTQAIYPHISKLIEADKNQALTFIRKIMKFYCGGNLLISIVLLIFANPIIHLLMGNNYDESINMLRILALLPFIISLSQIFGVQTMLPYGMNKEFSRIIIASAIVNTVLVFPLIFFAGGSGVCISMLCTETFVTLTMAYVLHKRHILL